MDLKENYMSKERMDKVMKGRTEIPISELKNRDDIFVITKYDNCGRSVRFYDGNFSKTKKYYLFDEDYRVKTEDCIFYKWTNRMNAEGKIEVNEEAFLISKMGEQELKAVINILTKRLVSIETEKIHNIRLVESYLKTKDNAFIKRLIDEFEG